MSTKTESEVLFESFCELHQIPWQPVPVATLSTPDYLVSLNGESVYVEVKQIDADQNFNTKGGVSSRTVGAHVRQKIFDSRKQVQVAKKEGVPGVLLIYNHLDPLQIFGTEQHDFVSAMYGEMTVVLRDSKISDSFHGRNSLLKNDQNTSFSAVAHLRSSSKGPTVRLYENVFARHTLNYPSLPPCFEVVRIEVIAGDA
jgi:hypothetical protein